MEKVMPQQQSDNIHQDPSFSFGTDILGQDFCNTLDDAIKSTESRPFDVVVVGSGMYGSYIASKLYYWSKRKEELGEEHRLKVLVLEAGPYIVHEHIENLPPKTGIFDENKEIPHMKSPYVCHVKRPGTGEVYFGTIEIDGKKRVTKHNYCVGGKALTWGKWSPRLSQETLESWPQEVREFLNDDNKGYKKVEDEAGVSDYSDLINGTLFKSLKALLEKKLEEPLQNHLKLMNPPVAVAANSTVSGLYSPDAFSSLGWLLENIRVESNFPDVPKASDPSWKSKSIFLVPNTLVYKLEANSGRVSRIHVVDSNSQKTSSFELSSNCDVILAGTAVESTRLVLNSFPRSLSLKEDKELIGRNLMGHLFSGITVRIKREALPLGCSVKWDSLIKVLLSKKGCKANSVRQKLKSLWGKLSRFKLIPLQLEDDVLEPALYHLKGYSKRFKKSYHFQLFCSSDPNFDTFATLYKMFYDLEALVDILKSQRSEWVTILIFSCSEVQGKPNVPLYTEGSNWLDLSKDQFDKPDEIKYAKPYLKWESSDEDEMFWDEVHSTLFEFLSSLVPFGSIEYLDPTNPKPTDNNNWKKEKPTNFDPYQSTEAFWNSRHESGTLWMGEHADQSVTDLDGKLHHIQNVYCADQAIFPTVGSANPVLTGLTLDRKITQAIIDRHKNFADEDDDIGEYRSLFDGTFNGWGIQDNGEHLILFNEVQILELQTKPNCKNGVAWYKLETFSEFDLIVDWKVFDYSANSGIIIHAPDPAKDLEADGKGYEIQIDESGYDYQNNIYGSPLHKTGAIYNLAPANRGNAKKPDHWNRFRIISTKTEIKTYLNGKLVSSLSPLLENKNTEGYICLQFHTNKIQFRNILIREH
jgi:Domain of Unknown Function (DUF1080)/GMC oxidoreductase